MREQAGGLHGQYVKALRLHDLIAIRVTPYSDRRTRPDSFVAEL